MTTQEQFPGFPGDQKALECIASGSNNFVEIYQWRGLDVVLGRATPPHPDVNLETCLEDGVTVRRRRGGGGAVVLMPGVWVITACYRRKNHNLDVSVLMNGIVGEIAGGLKELVGMQFTIRGMGDLCAGDKKILGSSLYISKEAILFQGSLLVNADLHKIARYLNHPSKEPDYRQGRKHQDFITNLASHQELETEQLKYLLKGVLLKYDPH